MTPLYADGIAYYQAIANGGYSGSLEMARYPDQMLQDISSTFPFSRADAEILLVCVCGSFVLVLVVPPIPGLVLLVERKVEKALKAFAWEKSVDYLSSERCYEIIYEIEV